MMDWIWRCVFFGFPLAVLIVWTILLTRNRMELRRVSAFLTIVFATISAYRGVWAQLHLPQLQARKGFDYGFEETTWLLSISAVIAGIVWTLRSRTKLSFLTLGVSGAMCFIWMMICATF
jgi:hypothetical protein